VLVFDREQIAYTHPAPLTPDGNRLRWVNDDGSLGDAVDLNDMGLVLQRFAQTQPALQG